MRQGLFAILLLFFCLMPARSLAASKALLRLGSFQHWADLSYSYTGEQSSTTDETEHRFEERYTLLGEYVVLNPRLWHGEFELNLGLEQEAMERSTGQRQKKTGAEMEYMVNGILFTRRPATIGLSALSRTLRRTQLNAPNYDLSSERYKVSLFLNNKKLPTRLVYLLSTSETDGLSVDRKTDSDHFTVQSRHTWGASQTELNLRIARQRTEFSSGSAALSSSASEYSLDNRLDLGTRQRGGALDSHFSYSVEENDTENERLTWSENLNLRLGKALTSGLSYRLTRNISTLSAERDETRTQAAGAFLQHQLFQSLASQIDFSGERQEALDGRQDSRRIGLGLTYRKKLGERTGMVLGVGGGYGVIDRKFEAGLRSAVGVSLTVQEVDNFLPDTGILPETVVVRSADRTTTYLEGTDYLLHTTGQVTEITFPLGSVITPGQVLSIDYQFLIDPSVRYATRTFHSTGSLNLFSNQLQFFYQFARSRQDLLEGEATSQSLTDARSIRTGMMIHRHGHRFRLTYGNQRTATNPSDFFEGLWSYSRKLLGGRWSMQLGDTYTIYRAAESGQGESRSNSLQASTTYSRTWGNKSLGTRAFYLNSEGRNTSREKLSMELEYAIALGKTQISLLSGVDWEWEDDRDSRNDRLQIRLRRYF